MEDKSKDQSNVVERQQADSKVFQAQTHNLKGLHEDVYDDGDVVDDRHDLVEEPTETCRMQLSSWRIGISFVETGGQDKCYKQAQQVQIHRKRVYNRIGEASRRERRSKLRAVAL